MKAVVIHNPWAWCITRSAFEPTAKTVENRGWATPHRGDLAIVEGRQLDGDAMRNPLVTRVTGAWLASYEDTVGEPPEPLPWDLSRGAVVCVVDLHTVCLVSRRGNGLCTCSPWAVSGQAHWRLGNARPLAVPLPVRGRQGLFDLPADADTAVRAQLALP